MTVITFEPRNVETPERALAATVTPAADFYVRSHFRAPEIEAPRWQLHLGAGLEAVRGDITLDRLSGAPRKELDVVLECAGNGRARYRPLPPGTPWGERAVACGRFAGVPLRDLVRVTDPAAREIVFAGADGGLVQGKEMSFERSLPVDVALHPDTLLCTHQDGMPLTPDHGAPVRLIVPRWFGVASVKWLASARATSTVFDGFYQRTHYTYSPTEPVTRMRVKSMLADPPARGRVGERVTLRGQAWSGEGAVSGVEVSTDGGASWSSAMLGAASGEYAWRAFEIAWTPAKSGTFLLVTRATDDAGNRQPWETRWNENGYGNNGMLVHRVLVEP